MSKVRKNTSLKRKAKHKRQIRIRSKLQGSTERPRLCIFRSNTHFYAQIIDDHRQSTLVSVSTLEKTNKNNLKNNKLGVAELGRVLAERAKKVGIEKIVFDRSGYIFHGRIQAFADSLREAGLVF